MLSGGILISGGAQDSVEPAGPDPHGRPGSPDLQVVTLYRLDTAILAVSGDLDVASAPLLRAHIGFALDRQPARLVLDLAGLRFCDATGLSVFVMAKNAATREDASLALAAVPRLVTRLLRMTGMNRILDVYPSVAAATA